LNNYCEAGIGELANSIPKHAVDYVKFMLQYCWTFVCYVKYLES